MSSESTDDDHETVVPSSEEDEFEDAIHSHAHAATSAHATAAVTANNASSTAGGTASGTSQLRSAIRNQLQILSQSLAQSSRMPTSSYVYRQADLPILDLETDRGDSFEAWLMKWDDYRDLSGLCDEPEVRQVRVLRRCMTSGTLTIVKNLGVPTNPASTTVAFVLEKLKEYAKKLVNVNVEWHNLMARMQLEHESIDDYVLALRQIAQACDTCNDKCEERAIRIQLVRGVRDEDTTKELLKSKDLTLEKAITVARANESARNESSAMREQATINRMSSYRKDKTSNKKENFDRQHTRQDKQSHSSGELCGYCGYQKHEDRSQCPARGQKCARCGKFGHFRDVCRAKLGPKTKVAQVRVPDPHNAECDETLDNPNPTLAAAVQVDNSGDMPCPYFYHVEASRCAAASRPAPRAEITCDIGGVRRQAVVLPDFGADVTVVGPAFLAPFKAKPGPPQLTSARAANGSIMQPEGAIVVTWSYGSKEYKETVHVMKDVETVLIGWEAALALGLLEMNFKPAVTTAAVNVEEIKVPERQDQLNGITIDQMREMLLNEFADVFSDRIKTMQGENFQIRLTSDAKPFKVTAPRSLPIAYKEPLRAELNQLQEQGIIEPVTHPTDWCSPIVIEPKQSGRGIRLCVDFTKLNKFVLRENYYSEPPYRQVANIASKNARYFTSIDATKGYHQCPLAEDSKDLTTFITPFGRFRYKRAPFGLSSISEHYNRRMDECLRLDPERTRRVTDDLAIFDSELKTHLQHVRNVLTQCRQKGITLSRDKFQFAKATIKFAGFILYEQGFSVDPEITAAIRSFRRPENITDLRAFFGLVNQLAATRSDIASLLTVLRPLLSPKNDFLWSEEATSAFEKAKQELCKTDVMTYFDLNRPTRLVTDASRTGLGFVLQQRVQDSWKTVQAGSRFLTETESRYAVIELELLAVCFAVKKCTIFLTGIPFTILTDHQPLLSIINQKRLDEIDNPRLRRMRYSLVAYKLTAEYIRGKDNAAADALSRSPHDQPSAVDTVPLVNNVRLQDDLLTEIIAARDATYFSLETLLTTSAFPDHKGQLPEALRPFWPVRSELFVMATGSGQSVIMCGRRVVIPRPLQKSVLNKLHIAHQGARRTKAYAANLVFWPTINNDIDNVVGACPECQRQAPANKKPPLMQPPLPKEPFEEVAADFFQIGVHHFLVLTDAFSGWPELIYIKKTPTALDLIAALQGIFARFGRPHRLRSDNGPQFMSHKTKEFLQQWKVQHITSAPRYPQSNGRAEAAVKSMKLMIKKVRAISTEGVDHGLVSEALLVYRNTPSQDGLSPAQKFLGRQTKCLLTYGTPMRTTKEEQQAAYEKRCVKQRESKYQYDRNAVPIQPVHQGAHVRVWNEQNKVFDKKAVVVAVGGQGRRLTLKGYDGKTLVRDRRHVRPCQPLFLPQLEPQSQIAGSDGRQESEGTPQQPLRRSTRVTRKPQRYIDEI